MKNIHRTPTTWNEKADSLLKVSKNTWTRVSQKTNQQWNKTWQMSTWKLLCIAIHQGNTNENCRVLTHTHEADWNLKAESNRTPHVGEDAEQLAFPFVLVEVSVNTASLKNGLPNPSKTQHTPTLWPALGNMPKRNEHLCALKDLCENIHSSFTPSSQQPEAMSKSINRRMDESYGVSKKRMLLAIKKTWVLINAVTQVNLTDMILSERTLK